MPDDAPTPRRRLVVVAIGDELTSGEHDDNNGPWIARAARGLGHAVVGLATVGDTVADVARAVRRAREDADLLITTGGLGPTADDLTRDGIAEALGLPLCVRADVLEGLRRHAGREPSPGSARQAELPEGAELLPNPRGTAPGFLVRADGFAVACVPGVPSEMRLMIRELLGGRLDGRAPDPALVSRIDAATAGSSGTLELMAAGVPESELGERLADLMDMTSTGLRVGVTTRAALHSVALRGGTDRERSDAADEVRRRLGRDLVAEGGGSLAGTVVRAAAERGLMLATAESCTGGLVAAAITSVPGSSDVFQESAVTYSNAAKRARLGVDASLLAEHGAVSEPVARAMAEGLRDTAGVDLALSITGIAGPGGGTEDKPVGTVFFGLADAAGSDVVSVRWLGSRDEIRRRSVTMGLDLLRRRMGG